MDPDKLQRLRKKHIQLKSDLDTTRVLDHLYSEGIFTDENCEFVRSKRTQADQNQELLTILKRTGNKGYDIFFQILQNSGSHLADMLAETEIDQEVPGEVLTENIFYNPSDDFELKGLIDQLTKDGRITSAQLERIKHYVIGEIGCSESVIRTKDSPQSLFRHLMDVKLVTRYNLAFLQCLFWRVDLKELCKDIAIFARKYDKAPIFFFSPRTTENGFVPCDLHVQGNVANFNCLTIEEICQRISRYLSLPRARVVPAGIKPSNSIILTIWIPEEAMAYFEAIGELSWLVDLGIDYITINNKTLTLLDNPERSVVTPGDEKAALERELQKKLENEKLIKHCLYNEQIENENLRNMYDQKETEHRYSKEDLGQQLRLNASLFCALMSTLHLVSQLLRYNLSTAAHEPYDLRERSARVYFKDVVRRARLVCRPAVLQEVIDAHSILKDVKYSRQLQWLMQSFKDTVHRLQLNSEDFRMYNAVGRMLGTQPLQLAPQAAPTGVTVRVEAVTSLMPDFDEIVVDLAKKLTPKQAARLVKRYRMPEELKSEAKKHEIFRQLFLAEHRRTNTLSDETVDGIMVEATVNVVGRRELWEEFKSRMKKRRQSHVRNVPDVTNRLDNIEKMLKHIVAQNLAMPFAAGIPFQTESLKIPQFSKQSPYFPFYKT